MRKTLKQFSDVKLSHRLLEEIVKLAGEYQRKFGRSPVLMEVCGSHTMALAKLGIKKLLAGKVTLLSGPGCPVCVTDQKSIDTMIELAWKENVTICTFGDMLRVPGSYRTLMDAKTDGKDIRVVYSPTDAVKIAEENKNREVVFLGIGFETTIPVLAVALKKAHEQQVDNFSMWMTTKLVEPILRKILEEKEVLVDAFLLPGHVSIVLGKKGYQYLVDEYQVPGVICGFEMVEILGGIYEAIDTLLQGQTTIINSHKHVVNTEGNKIAQQLMQDFFKQSDEDWRGIGRIKNSGLDIRTLYRHLDAKQRFNVVVDEPRITACCCGEVIRGLLGPNDCPLFGKVCHPLKPIGPCMVSSEGSCAAAFHYLREEK